MLCWKIGNRTSRELLKEFARTISKSSSSSNSEAVVRKKDRFGEESVPNVGKHVHVKDKWSQISRQNNIRALSTIQTKVKPQANNAFFSKEESREFMAVFPDIVRDLTDAGRHTDIPEVTKRFVKVLQYNVPTGKKTRGLSTVVAYKMLEKQENLTPENVRLANVLGWCVELLRGFGLVIDDFIDNSEMRRQLPCWYRKEGVGTLAVMDATLLEHSVYTILRKHFSHLPSYVPLVEVFRDASAKNALGKSLDGVITNGGSPVLDKFTMKNYNLIMKYRTGYYSFQLPLASAMYLANLYDKEQHRQAKTIILEMGEFFQIQLQSFFLVLDDVMDGAEYRRGQLAWHRNEDVGLQAINDSILLESGLYAILRKYISHLPCYVPIMESFSDITLKTSMGQLMDMMHLNKDHGPDLDKFTMNRYKIIVKYKTAYYSFYLPVAVAMYLANMNDPEQHRQAKTILLEMGEFYQIQDDFIDCFGNPEQTGKVGTDIQEGKCSWPAVVALQRASPSQRAIMEEYYGRGEPDSVKIVKNLYEDLNIPSTYAIHEEETVNLINTHIQQISKGLPHQLFLSIMKRIYKRNR